MTNKIDDLAEALRRVGHLPDSDIDLAETALILAALDDPDADLDFYRNQLHMLVADARETTHGAPTLETRAKALSYVVCDLHGFEGDRLSYDDMDNANLIRVFDRRKGLPVALGIIFVHTARALGWSADGLSFPAHFLVGMGEADTRVVIDPFHAGRVLSEFDLQALLNQASGPGVRLSSDHLAAVDNRAILIRLLNNIKGRAQKAGEIERALEINQRMMLLAPTALDLLIDHGALAARVGHLGLAISTLESLSRQTSRHDLRLKGSRMLEDLKRRLN